MTIDPVLGLIKRFQSTEYSASSDQFGWSVSIGGDYAIIGANYNDTAGSNAGAAYIFKKDQGGADNWGLIKKLNSTEYIASADQFGYSVSIGGDYAIIGANYNDTAGSYAGAAYIFKKDQGGADNWGLSKKLLSSEYIVSGDEFGCSVFVDGYHTIVGAFYHDAAGLNAGAAYIFNTTISDPPVFTSITPDNGLTTGGTSVTITGSGFIPGGSFGVTIGDLDASGVYVSATTITATSPAHAAGAVDVVITNNDGQTVTGTGAYTYNTPAPAPTSAPAPAGGGSNTNTGVGASQNLKAGETASFGFEGKGAVDGLSVKVNEDTPNLMVTVKKQSSLPSSVEKPDTLVYEYEDVKIYHADASDVSGGVFEFEVSKSWLSSKGYTMDDVVMLHYKDSEWVALPTEFVREKGGYYYYTAETPSFSWFAIGIGEGQTIIHKDMAEKTETPASTPIITEAKTPAATTVPESVPPMKDISKPDSMPVLVIVLIFIVVMIAGAVIWQRKQKNKYPEWWDKKL